MKVKYHTYNYTSLLLSLLLDLMSLPTAEG